MPHQDMIGKYYYSISERTKSGTIEKYKLIKVNCDSMIQCAYTFEMSDKTVVSRRFGDSNYDESYQFDLAFKEIQENDPAIQISSLLEKMTSGIDKNSLITAIYDLYANREDSDAGFDRALLHQNEDGRKFYMAYFNHIENPNIFNKMGDKFLDKEMYDSDKLEYKTIRNKKYILWKIERTYAAQPPSGFEGDDFCVYNKKQGGFFIRKFYFLFDSECSKSCFEHVEIDKPLFVKVPDEDVLDFQSYINKSSGSERQEIYVLFKISKTKITSKSGYNKKVKQVILTPLKYLIVWNHSVYQKTYKNFE